MRILITGVAGFVGSRLAKSLLDQNHTVVGFDNFDPYYDRAHKDRHLRDLLPNSSFTFLEADLRNPDSLLRSSNSTNPKPSPTSPPWPPSATPCSTPSSTARSPSRAP